MSLFQAAIGIPDALAMLAQPIADRMIRTTVERLVWTLTVGVLALTGYAGVVASCFLYMSRSVSYEILFLGFGVAHLAASLAVFCELRRRFKRC